MFARKLICFVASFALSVLAASATAEDCANSRTWIPPGSVTWQPAANVLAYRPPSGYSLVQADGSFVLSAKHTCDCSNASGGCNPTITPSGHTSCDSSNCTNGCSGKRGAVAIRDTGEAITFASRQSAHNLPQALPELMALPFVRAEIADFMQRHNGNTPPPAPTFANNRFHAPAGYVYTLLDVRGYLVPALIDRHDPSLAGAINAVAISCACKKGSGCVATTGDQGIQYCAAGECKSCELSTVEQLGGGAQIETIYGF